MENLIIIVGIAVVTILSGTGYYLIWKKELDEFEARKSSKTEYRTNEEFINS
ncbi:hypothetical protein [Rhodohalobacter sp. SW132]|uniref:hypothetical protein n=1 Tax=Rhodohalobacter sp. SW132 TaxID=2293433 RepID=UPI001315A385|nr:hypothetical protein [Rhodohalobacter sp. SW132]